MKNPACKIIGQNKVLAIVLVFLCSACVPIEKIPSRSMGVSSGPDKAFQQPVAEVMPQIAGATATGNNGRVGNELVFWEYQLADNNKVNLFACALLDDVNCEARAGSICPVGGEELSRKVISGNVRQLDCHAVGIVGTGDLRPNCEDNEVSNDMLVGLMQCQ